jgi:hypothetical protein
MEKGRWSWLRKAAGTSGEIHKDGFCGVAVGEMGVMVAGSGVGCNGVAGRVGAYADWLGAGRLVGVAEIPATGVAQPVRRIRSSRMRAGLDEDVRSMGLLYLRFDSVKDL